MRGEDIQSSPTQPPIHTEATHAMALRKTGTLFERLDALADDMRDGEGADGFERSVRHHLTKILNTRAGSVAIQLDYGLSDFNDVARENPDLPGTVALEVARLIQRYEPRLTNVSVVPHPSPDDPTGLHFTITALLKHPDGRRVVTTFDLSLGRNQRAAFR